MTRRSKRQLVLLGILAVLLASGCKKKPAPVAAAAPPPPPPPAPTKPTATLSANPTSIERGQSTTIEWRTTDATTVRIEPEIGTVPASGSRSVRPTQSTTYRITATGPGGSADASARVTVTNPPATPDRPVEKPREETITQAWAKVQPILFDYDKYEVRADQRSAFDSNVAIFKRFPSAKIQVQGNCDERGSAEYNLGLGDKRANTMKEALIGAGIAADRLSTISYGKEKPVCSEESEACWQKNRRADFVNP